MKKVDHQIKRSQVKHFEQIINIGPAMARDFKDLGLAQPQELIGKNPWQLYEKLVTQSGTFHDPCVLDVFIATIDFMNGNPPQAWWEFTEERKRRYGKKVVKLRAKVANES